MAENVRTTPTEPVVPVRDPSTAEPRRRRRLCHALDLGGRALCGQRLSGKGTHSLAACRAAGHLHCEVCELLDATEGIGGDGHFGEVG